MGKALFSRRVNVRTKSILKRLVRFINGDSVAFVFEIHAQQGGVSYSETNTAKQPFSVKQKFVVNRKNITIEIYV